MEFGNVNGMDGLDGMTGLVIPQPQPYRPNPGQESVPQTMGALADFGFLEPIWKALETRVLGIPLWALGVGGYFLVNYIMKKARETPSDDYGPEFES